MIRVYYPAQQHFAAEELKFSCPKKNYDDKLMHPRSQSVHMCIFLRGPLSRGTGYRSKKRGKWRNKILEIVEVQ